MSSPLLDELYWLTEALQAHVQWSSTTGSLGLPASDEVWLEKRRDHYRKTELKALGSYDGASSRAHLSLGNEAPTSDEQQAAAAQSPPSPHIQVEPTPPSEATRTAIPSPTPSRSPVTIATSKLAQAAGASEVKRTPIEPGQKQTRLVALQDAVQSCTSCGLCNERKHPAFARGNGSSGIVFVGEGPGAEEDAQGLPFVGAAGQLLDRMIHAMGLAREDVYVCNIIKCRPPNNRKPADDEIAACRHFLVEQLELVQPQVIVALGATAVEGLLGLKLGITRLRGTWRLYEGRIPVMPTFHPAYLLRKPEAKREVWEDLQAVLARVNRAVPPRG